MNNNLEPLYYICSLCEQDCTESSLRNHWAGHRIEAFEINEQSLREKFVMIRDWGSAYIQPEEDK